jgi:hypothetical protein
MERIRDAVLNPLCIILTCAIAIRAFRKQTWADAIMRKMVFNYMPAIFQRMIYTKSLAYRPQANFLSKVENRGTGAALPQKESRRYQRLQRAAKAWCEAGKKVYSAAISLSFDASGYPITCLVDEEDRFKRRHGWNRLVSYIRWYMKFTWLFTSPEILTHGLIAARRLDTAPPSWYFYSRHLESPL